MPCKATKVLHEELDKIDEKFEKVLAILRKLEDRTVSTNRKYVRKAIQIIEEEQ